MRKQHSEDDDDAFDERGVLKDRRSWRVPMYMQDSLQTDVAGHFSRPRVVDGQGRDGLSLSRPGFRRFEDGGAAKQPDDLLRAREMRDEAYRDYLREINAAWKGKARDADIRTDTDRATQLRDLLEQLGYPGTDIERFVQECENNGDLDDSDLDALVRRFEAPVVSGYGDAQLRDHVSVEEIQRKHQKRMATLNDAYSLEIGRAWASPTSKGGRR